MTAPLPRRPLWKRDLVNEVAEYAVVAAEIAGLPALKDLYLGGMHWPELSFASLADAEAWAEHGTLRLLVEVCATDAGRVRYAQLFPGSQSEPEWMVEVRYPAPVATDVDDDDPRAWQDGSEEQILAAMRQERYAREAGR